MPSTCLSNHRPGVLVVAVLAVAAVTSGRAGSAGSGSSGSAGHAGLVASAGSGADGAAEPPAAAARGIDLAAERAGLAGADRAFARLSRQQGMRAAFLAYMGDDAVLFRPGPVPGRPYMEARPSPAIELTWAPVHTAVAASGDFGYTTGPYEVRGTGPDRALEEQGYYVTVWRKQPDGAWKVAVDQGVATPPPTAADAAALREPGGPAPAAAAGAAAAAAAPSRDAQNALLAAERAFGTDAGAHGLPAAYLARLAPDARLYRADALPVAGREAIARALAASPQEVTTWQVTAAGASAAGDLGYTYGDLVPQKHGAPPTSQPSAMYLRLWQRQSDGSYKIVLDLVRALPPPPAPPRQ
jgi:ketosteroid isomerase-like protein